MAITIKYDRPTDNQLAVDSTLPIGRRNMSRIDHNFATVSGQITLDSSYPTGGYGLMNSFGLVTVAGVFFEDANGYGLYYNKTTDKVQVFSTAGTEVTNGTNLSTLPAIYFEAKGLV